MNEILLYQRLCEIKPSYHKLQPPYLRPSVKKVQFNLNELDLFYNSQFKVYLTEEKIKAVKKGGAPQKITYAAVDFDGE